MKLIRNWHVPVQKPNASFTKFLNRLLGVDVDMQRKIFDYFTAFHVRDPCHSTTPCNCFKAILLSGRCSKRTPGKLDITQQRCWYLRVTHRKAVQ